VSERTTFIGMRLVDQDGTPVPRRRYRIALATGPTLREGRLDARRRPRPGDMHRNVPGHRFGKCDRWLCERWRANAAPPAGSVDLTWVVIQLAGDPAVYSGLAYELTTPDGNVHAGTFDASGMVRVDGVPPGTCKLRFPEKADGDVIQTPGGQ
jgi:hypothetical protein